MDPSVHDHLRPTDADVTPGVYRVVGTGDRLALLRVADGDGNRESTGKLVHVAREDLDGFEPAPDPDAGFSPVGTVLEGLEGIAISIRELFRR